MPSKDRGHSSPSLNGQVALVTGASGDIGGATARRLAELGARVAVHYYSGESGAQGTLDAIRAAGGDGVVVRADVGKASEVEGMVHRLEADLGPISLLVNNSGVMAGPNRVEELTISAWERVLAVNLTAAFLLTKAVVPGMRKLGHGRIVNVSSICGVSGDCEPAYSASKAGLLGLTRACAARLAPVVQVNAVLPGFVGVKYHAAEEGLVRTVAPDGRISSPEEIAELIVFLLSMQSGFLTGACIPIDGGASVASLGMHMNWVRDESA